MKKNRQIAIAVLVLFMFATNTFSAPARSINSINVFSMIQQKKFHFKVQTVLTGGPEWVLTDNSMISVNDTTFSCYLPTYTGLDFTSQSFDYKIRRKKNRQIVSIRNTVENSDQFLLSLTEDGYGTLTIMHPDGSGITFRGIVVNE